MIPVATEDLVLKLFREPEASTAEIAAAAGVSTRTVQRVLAIGRRRPRGAGSKVAAWNRRNAAPFAARALPPPENAGEMPVFSDPIRTT
jgi:hypothetical protein